MDNCTVCAECNDSILSIVSNVFGILTGVLALLAAIYVRFRLVRQAAHEIAQIQTETTLRLSIFSAKISGMNISPMNMSPVLRECVQRLQASMKAVMSLMVRVKGGWTPPRRGRSLGIGIKYMLLRDDLKDSVDEMMASHNMLNDALEVRCVRISGTKLLCDSGPFTETEAQRFSAHRSCRVSI